MGWAEPGAGARRSGASREAVLDRTGLLASLPPRTRVRTGSRCPRMPEEFLWYWINERHRIYLRRQAGEPKPWSADPVFQTTRFANVRRVLDRGTQFYLRFHLGTFWRRIREETALPVWRVSRETAPHWRRVGEELLFTTILYRLFNLVETGELIGWVTAYDPAALAIRLRARWNAGLPVFTPAHIIRSEAGRPKIESLCELAAIIWADRHRLFEAVLAARRMEPVVAELARYHCIGGFMAYQFVLDFTYGPLLPDPDDWTTWAAIGPGCTRGLRLLDPAVTPETACATLRWYWKRSCEGGAYVRPGVFHRAPGYPVEPHVPRLDLCDMQTCLSEAGRAWRLRAGVRIRRIAYPGTGTEREAAR